jgi:single-strand DNA-binding protein
MLEGKLHLDQWEDKNGGGKRSKHKLVVDNIQLLDPRQDGATAGYGGKPAGSRSASSVDDGGGDEYGNEGGGGSGGGGDDPIPF